MNPPGITTLSRMHRAAFLEAERIEIGQDARVQAGLIKAPLQEMVERRDDFAGLVRLIDLIYTDQILLERVERRIKEQTASRVAPAPAAEDLAIDAEADA
jgi:hypothetical protein